MRNIQRNNEGNLLLQIYLYMREIQLKTYGDLITNHQM